jgi:hypothetical protein
MALPSLCRPPGPAVIGRGRPRLRRPGEPESQARHRAAWGCRKQPMFLLCSFCGSRLPHSADSRRYGESERHDMARPAAGDMPHNINMLRWGVRFVTKEGRLNPESALRKSAGWRPECRSSLAGTPAQRMPNQELEGMTLPSRHPRPLYSAPAPQGQEGANAQAQLHADADTGRRGHGIEDQVLAALEEAARAVAAGSELPRPGGALRPDDGPADPQRPRQVGESGPHPPHRHPGRQPLRDSGARADHRTSSDGRSKAGPFRPAGSSSHRLESHTRQQPDRAPASGPLCRPVGDRPAWSCVHHGCGAASEIADAAARDRLLRVAGRGHLAQRADGRFILAEPAAPASDGVRVEIRDGVRVTICPPRHADGALVFRQALSGGRRGS